MQFFAILCAVALTVGGAAFASTADVVHVHFATPVMVGTTMLPAGNVSIQIVRGSNGVLLNARSESGAVAVAPANRIYWFSDKDGSAAVVLERRGNAVQLEKVWLDDHTGFEVMSRGE